MAGALPGSGLPGWAVKPEFDAPHAAEFVLAAPVELGEGDRLRVLLQQEHGARHTLGRFRVLLAGEDPGADRALVPAAWKEAWDARRAQARRRPGLPMTMVMEEREVPRGTRRFHRGSFLDPREPWPRASPPLWTASARSPRPWTTGWPSRAGWWTPATRSCSGSPSTAGGSTSWARGWW